MSKYDGEGAGEGELMIVRELLPGTQGGECDGGEAQWTEAGSRGGSPQLQPG